MSQAERTVESSEGERARPRVVVASTVTTMRVGPSRIDFREAPTGLLEERQRGLRLSMGPLAMMETVLA